MKHLKSSLCDLHQIFDRSVTVRHLAEPFASFDVQRLATEVRDFMVARDFDIVGVRDDGAVVGYVNRATLKEGTLEQYLNPFDEELILDEGYPVLEALQLLAESPHVFVVAMGEVSGIITKGDLQKAPIRMWLFGVLSLIEMQLLRLIRVAYPQDSWTNFISDPRIEDARKLWRDRKQRNEAIDLADCLQFADKRTIVLKSDSLMHALGFPSKGKGEKFLKALETLRNDLDHAQDIITGRWPQLVELAQRAEEFLKDAEAFEPEAEG